MTELSSISQQNGTLQNGNKPEELDPIQTKVTRDVIETILKTYNSSLKLLDFNAKVGSGVGDNYMSLMYAVDIKVQDTKAKVEQNLNIMLKTMPINPARQYIVNDSGVFVKEVVVYGKIFPGFELYQKKFGLNENEIYSDYPKYYASFIDGKTDYLAMENLRPSGYTMADRQKGLDKNHINLVLKSLAKFHACSYAQFNGNYSAIIKKYPDAVEKMFLCDSKPTKVSQILISTSMKNNIKLLREAGFETEAKVLEGPNFSTENILNIIIEMIGKPVKHAVIGHGDFWTNNMLFKYDQSTGKPIDIKLLDFQLVRACSRSIDLLHFLTTCPQDEFVNSHEDEFLQTYYAEFSSFVRKLGISNPELTFEQLQEEYNAFRAFGIVISLLMMQFYYNKAEDLKDMESVSGEISEDQASDYFAGMTNNIVLSKIINIINVHIPKVKF